MSQPESGPDDNLAPRLLPAYWDGHAIGTGELSPPNHRLSVPRAYQSFAEGVIMDYLLSPGGRVALEVYRKGDSFNPSNYSPGTIVAMDREKLIGPSVDAVAWPSTDDVPSVVPDASIPGTKGLVGVTKLFGKAGPLMYHHGTQWGVVVAARRGRSNRLVTPAVAEGRPDLILQHSAVLYFGNIMVGQTVHTRIKEVESLRRVNALEVCDRGVPPKKGSRGLGIGRLRFST